MSAWLNATQEEQSAVSTDYDRWRAQQDPLEPPDYRDFLSWLQQDGYDYFGQDAAAVGLAIETVTGEDDEELMSMRIRRALLDLGA